MNKTKLELETLLGEKLTDKQWLTMIFLNLNFPTQSLEAHYQDFLYLGGKLLSDYPFARFCQNFRA